MLDKVGEHEGDHLLVLVLAHLPFALGLAPFTWRGEARIVAFVILFWIVEDFLWFAVNPAFGVRRFTPRHAWWHAGSWWGFMPRDYWIFLPIAIALYIWSLG